MFDFIFVEHGVLFSKKDYLEFQLSLSHNIIKNKNIEFLSFSVKSDFLIFYLI